MSVEQDSVEPSPFRGALDETLWALNAQFLREVPSAHHLTDGETLDEGYYVRHRIETIKRIRMTARTDALALAQLITIDYDAARVWARYACEELDHDRMFYDDLARHGVSRAMADTVEPMAATARLGEFLEDEIQIRGPIAAIAYSVFVEWNSERFSARAVEKARAAFGDEAVRGSSDHLLVGQEEGHFDDMLALAERLSETDGDRHAFLSLINTIAGLFRSYFKELSLYRGWSTAKAA